MTRPWVLLIAVQVTLAACASNLDTKTPSPPAADTAAFDETSIQPEGSPNPTTATVEPVDPAKAARFVSSNVGAVAALYRIHFRLYAAQHVQTLQAICFDMEAFGNVKLAAGPPPLDATWVADYTTRVSNGGHSCQAAATGELWSIAEQRQHLIGLVDELVVTVQGWDDANPGVIAPVLLLIMSDDTTKHATNVWEKWRSGMGVETQDQDEYCAEVRSVYADMRREMTRYTGWSENKGEIATFLEADLSRNEALERCSDLAYYAESSAYDQVADDLIRTTHEVRLAERNLRRAYGLPDDEHAIDSTPFDMLYDPYAPPPPPRTVPPATTTTTTTEVPIVDRLAAYLPLSEGATGSSVSALQRLLIIAGASLVPDGRDGQFGPITTRAVEAVQAAYGLPVTGVVDVATLVALRDAEEQAGASPDYPDAPRCLDEEDFQDVVEYSFDIRAPFSVSYILCSNFWATGVITSEATGVTDIVLVQFTGSFWQAQGASGDARTICAELDAAPGDWAAIGCEG